MRPAEGTTPAGDGTTSAPAGVPGRRTLLVETLLVLGVSLGASAVYALLSLIRKLTEQVALNQQTTAMNSAITPDRPWLDLAYQLAGIGFGVVPALLAIHLLGREGAWGRNGSTGRGIVAGAAASRGSSVTPTTPATPTTPGGPGATGGPGPAPARRHGGHAIGADLGRPAYDLGRGVLLAAAIGIPGLGFYLAARALGANTSIAAANLTSVWWAVPVLVLAAVQNSVLEEVVMIGYLFTRWGQAGWRPGAILGVSALIRGAYHLYQGFGGFLGNLVMGLVFGLVYRRTGRVGPLIVAHTLLDVVAFVGYALLRGHLSWL